MNKKATLTPEQFVAEMNHRLPQKFGYKPGLRVFLYPEGATAETARGVDWTFRDELNSVVAVKAAHDDVAAQYDAVLPLREDAS
ncbi:hypothetical protein [Bordetella hinzii]|uniref:Phage protein n=1 Tax=Bordetella hinzii OH87 BAL007II TaxID=1331262 RepID=A0ABR4R316_9BORD|nr:hypothetical protein [Bordetella hinzii]KCB24881.1 hypothetical protein L544_1072 [Bordetella hinzii OH87 BAL007II]QDJ43820.1 hypothetical protein CBR70_22330 [Bordetella hinzii]